MGQQQLLLVILVTILVGIATVVAINVFGTQAQEANRDAVRQDILGAAAQAQGYFQRPGMMGGGGNSFDGIGISNLGIAGVTEATPSNQNGWYQITAPLGNEFTIVGHPASSVAGFNPNGGEQTVSTDPLTAVVTVDADGVSIDWGS